MKTDFSPRTSSKNRTYTVDKENTLKEFLFEQLDGQSKTTIKSLLTHKQITINGKPESQYDYPLNPGDRIGVYFDRTQIPFSHPKLKILYEDSALIVIEKMSGLLSMGTERDKENTAYRILSNYVKRTNPRNCIFIVHRLDRDTSGIMMFAKNQEIQKSLQSNWKQSVPERKYVALVEGQVEKESGKIQSYITENTTLLVHRTTADQGKLAITHYKVLKSDPHYSLLELELETGRKNQIRVHMQQLGHPVAGDPKYGARTNPLHRLALHAFQLKFIHPVTHQEMNFETPIPSRFKALIKSNSR